MKRFEYIPDDLLPEEDKHVDYKDVFRAIRNADVTESDFLPSIVENPNFAKQFEKRTNLASYSVSLLKTETQLKKIYNASASFRKKYNAIAKGFTSKERGYSYKADKNGHINYFLFDYEDNNPYSDFEFYKEMKDVE